MGFRNCCRIGAALLCAALGSAQANIEVQGRVLDTEGKPVAAAALAVIEHPDQLDVAGLLRSPPFTTDPNGRYRCEMAPGRTLVVAARDRQVVAVRGRLRNHGAVELPPVVLLPATTLRGRVRDADGKPIRGATVLVEDSLPENPVASIRLLSAARTDADGVFVVPGVPFTGMQLIVHALGFASLGQRVSHDSPLDVALAATGVVQGTVLRADGKPVQDAIVQPSAIEALGPVARVVTDSLGRFTMTVPPVPRFRIEARSAGSTAEYRSGWLRGAEAGVEVRAVEAVAEDATVSEGMGAVIVRCVDAETGAPIRRFQWSYCGPGVGSWANAMLAHRSTRTAAEGEAIVTVSSRRERSGWVVVDAPGRGFAVRELPAGAAEPMLVELYPESVLVGRVVDAETGRAAVGAAVRALPRNNLHGRGPDPFADGAITDADGRYRIEGLPSGPIDVQVHGRGRPAAVARRCVLEIGKTTSLDLEVPPARFLEVELVGELPAESLAHLRLLEGSFVRGVDQPMSLWGGLPVPPETPLAGLRRLRLGPLDVGELRGRIVVPGRHRTGSEVTIQLGPLTDGPLQLPDLRFAAHAGRVELPSTVEPTRIAVFARRCTAAGREPTYELTPSAAALRSDGTFGIDLLPGRYVFQVVDLETGIAFFTEREDRELDATTARASIELRPALHWLHLELVPAAGAELGVSWLDLSVPRQREGVPVRFQWQNYDNGAELDRWPCPAGARKVQWLLPPGTVQLVAKRVGADGAPRVVGSETVEVLAGEQRLSMRIAPVEVVGLPAGEVGK
ncbi:MAG: carboxypeptidase-like regulatory domain-containing protein [Planctomycetes bacterium]|nr:carboxypeptidase-like regulatory domain-containing protein [Planctomycetota bacterium]